MWQKLKENPLSIVLIIVGLAALLFLIWKLSFYGTPQTAEENSVRQQQLSQPQHIQQYQQTDNYYSERIYEPVFAAILIVSFSIAIVTLSLIVKAKRGDYSDLRLRKNLSGYVISGLVLYLTIWRYEYSSETDILQDNLELLTLVYIYFLAASFYSLIFRKKESDEIDSKIDLQYEGASRSNLKSVAFVTKDLHNKAKGLRFEATIILVAIFGVLGLGFYTFEGAEAGASASSRLLFKLEQQIDSSNTSIRNLERKKQQLIDVIDKERTDSIPLISTLGQIKLQNELPNILVSQDPKSEVSRKLELEKMLAETKNKLEQSQEFVRQKETQLLQTKASLEAEWQNNIRLYDKHIELSKGQDSSNGQNPFNYALSLISTKIGAVLLLIFGAKILVNLYQYNTRLASFNESRANVLMLLDKQCLDARRIVALLRNEKLAFTELPEDPSQKALAMTKEILKAVPKTQ